MTRLFFQGDLSLVLAVALSATVACGTAWYYRRETKELLLPHAWLLPLLRAMAIFITLMMLSGPVVQRKKEIGTIGRVDVFVDASASMLATDSGQPSGKPEADAATEPAVASAEMATTASRGDKSRLQRVSGLLLGNNGQPGWLESVRQTHHVFLHVMVDDDAKLIWDSRSDLPIPNSLTMESEAIGQRTNLSDPIAVRVLTSNPTVAATGGEESTDGPAAPAAEAKLSGQPRSAVLLFSDGQHNSGDSPQPLAQRLGDATISVFAVGLGSPVEPRDVAVLGINVPPTVAANGRASGEITIKDLAGEGAPVRVRIMMGDQTVWQQTLVSGNQTMRRVPFDFAIAPLAAQVQTLDAGGIQRTRLTLPLSVSVDPIEGQYDAGNNRLDFRIAANLRKRRLLIVDSRSRWESRYIRNLFDRDPTWQVDSVIAWPRSAASGATRYHLEGEFPPDAQSMAGYDAVIWGDCGPDAFTEDDMRRLRDFASQGGAVVFIDGDRDGLKRLAKSPAGPLLPVRIGTEPLLVGARAIRPTTVGAGLSALRLSLDDRGAQTAVAATDSAAVGKSNAADSDRSVWSTLLPPTTIRDAEVLPGAEVWLEADLGDTAPATPLLVTRLFGGGQVVYLATDQTWRWRYRVADRYHTRFWNQLLEAVMQPPFEVRDQYIAIATGSPQYTAGQSATIRARLRDANGRPVGDAVVEAVLRDTAGNAQTVLLRSIDADRGVYEAQTQPLGPGEFDVSIRSAGYASSQAVRTSLLVVPQPNRETARLAQDENLLRSLATVSGGIYADEADVENVWRAIKPLSDGRIETNRLALAQSYLWFVAVLGLLSTEWWLRKKAGLV